MLQKNKSEFKSRGVQSTIHMLVIQKFSLEVETSKMVLGIGKGDEGPESLRVFLAGRSLNIGILENSLFAM